MVSESLIWTRPLRPHAWPATVEWRISDQPVAYPEALAAMEARAAAIAEGTAGEQVWLLEHPPIYTAGTSAKDADLIDARFPVYRTGRGGQFTYHGPGQRVGYVMLDLKQPQARCARLCARPGAMADRDAGRSSTSRASAATAGSASGCSAATREDKIAALGVRIRRWVTLSWRGAERRSRPVAFRRHRALRRERPMASPAWPIWGLSPAWPTSMLR